MDIKTDIVNQVIMAWERAGWLQESGLDNYRAILAVSMALKAVHDWYPEINFDCPDCHGTGRVLGFPLDQPCRRCTYEPVPKCAPKTPPKPESTSAELLEEQRRTLRRMNGLAENQDCWSPGLPYCPFFKNEGGSNKCTCVTECPVKAHKALAFGDTADPQCGKCGANCYCLLPAARAECRARNYTWFVPKAS